MTASSLTTQKQGHLFSRYHEPWKLVIKSSQQMSIGTPIWPIDSCGVNRKACSFPWQRLLLQSFDDLKLLSKPQNLIWHSFDEYASLCTTDSNNRYLHVPMEPVEKAKNGKQGLLSWQPLLLRSFLCHKTFLQGQKSKVMAMKNICYILLQIQPQTARDVY